MLMNEGGHCEGGTRRGWRHGSQATCHLHAISITHRVRRGRIGVAQRRGPLRATYSATLSLEPIAFLTRYADTHARRSTAERLALRRQRALAARVPSSASDILLRSQLKKSCQELIAKRL